MLAASLLLSALPITSFSTSAAPHAWSEGTDTRATELPGESGNSRKDDRDRPAESANSVRPRGREAPIDLRQVAADDDDSPPAVGADPGDGPPPARKDEKSAREDRAREDARNANIRTWPMPAESYTFTQPFGCVPQIAHFYQPGDGCPVDRPVVHTGLDLAAPEGTPFYAAASGWVTEAGYDREVGVANTRIIIQHEGGNEGYATEYLHWIASFVEVGDHVEAGQLIGEVGSVGYSTGPHLHFALIDLASGEHTDPTRWLPREPGTEGYRGVTPRRAAMRLPAGTTAGVPEYTDPNPPDVPTREDVPETADEGHERNDRGKGKKDKKHEDRRKKDAAGNNREKDSRSASAKDGSEEENRDRERVRKRERNRDGAARSKDASGEDATGGSRKERRNRSGGDNSESRKNDKRASRKDENAVEQTDTREKGNTRDNSGGGGGGNKKNRQKDEAQQVVEEAPAPVEATPSADQGKSDVSGAGRNDKDGDNGADNPDGNGGTGQDNPDGEDGNGENRGDGETGDKAERGDGTEGQGGNGGSGGVGGDAKSRSKA